MKIFGSTVFWAILLLLFCLCLTNLQLIVCISASSNLNQVISQPYSSHIQSYIDRRSTANLLSSIVAEDSISNNPTTPYTLSYKLELLSRGLFLLFLFFPVILTTVFAAVSPAFAEHIWYPMLAYLISKSGAAFIKWGQWASTRPDAFPPALCRQLTRLQAAAPTHSLAFTRREIQMALNASCPLDELFDSFDTLPLASGSIAQVYRAVYKGQDVAVKVRHPNVARRIAVDFDLMQCLAAFLVALPKTRLIDFRSLQLSESLSQFSNSLGAQTDLSSEAAQLDRFLHNFHGNHGVIFPRPILATDAVLIESLLSPVSFQHVPKLVEQVQRALIDDTTSDTQRKALLTAAMFIVAQGEAVYLQMLLKDHFMHADLHPGNILFSPAHPMQIGLVDAGLVAILTAEQRTHFTGLLIAVGAGDSKLAAECLLAFKPPTLAPYSPQTIAAVHQEMQALFAVTARGYGTGTRLGNVLRGALAIVRRNGLGVEANYATLIVNALCLDGLADSLLPQPLYNILDGAKEMLGMANQMRKRLPPAAADKVTAWMSPFAMNLKHVADQRRLQQLLSMSKEEVKRVFLQSKSDENNLF